jgi:hypothetical protein
MKAPQQILCFALALMLCSTGWARIGETLEDCIERYGSPREGFGLMDKVELTPPEGVDCKIYKFEKHVERASGPSDLITIFVTVVHVTLLDNSVERIIYRKSRAGRDASWTDDEVKTLLENNGFDGKISDVLIRTGRPVIGITSNSTFHTSRLGIETRGFADKVAKAKSQAASKGLGDF